MSKPLSISQIDILRSKIITPGWYPATLTKVEDTTAKTSGADGWIVTFVIDKEGEFKGVPVDARFYESAPGFAAPLVAALSGKKQADAGNYTLENGVGKKLVIYVVNGKYNNRLTNNIEDFKPLGS